MSAPLQYTLSRMGSNPSSENLSELLVLTCVDESWLYRDENIVRNLVNELHGKRQAEADNKDACVAVLDDPEKEFRRAYKEACEDEGHPWNEEQPNWADHWPLDCNWHPNEIRRIARIQVRWAEEFRKQWQEMMEARKCHIS